MKIIIEVVEDRIEVSLERKGEISYFTLTADFEIPSDFSPAQILIDVAHHAFS